MPGFAYRVFAAVAVAWIPVIIDAEAIEQAARLHPLANSANPYFVPSHAFLLYLRAPLAALSGIVLCLSPGLILALARKSSSDISRWLVSGFGLSLASVSVVSGTVQAFLSEPLRGLGFKVLLVICSVLSLGFLRWRLGRCRQTGQLWKDRYAPATLLSLVLVPWLLLVVLAPKFYWETFNADGNQAFEVGRLLLWQPLPFWRAEAGFMADFPGWNSMLFAFPTSWFIRLFGEFEASARLPLVLYLMVLYGAIVALANHGRSHSVPGPERWSIWLGLGIYLVVVAYSATYNPYSADLGEPATHDTMLMVCFLALVIEFLQRNTGWLCLWVLLTYLSWPIAPLLVGLWLASVILVWPARPWRPVVITLGALLACMLAGGLAPAVLASLGLPTPGGEYNWKTLVESVFNVYQIGAWLQLSFLWQVPYLERWAFLIFPTGVVPALALLAWRRHDFISRAVVLTTLGYFAFFYVQAFVSLHYFVPAMILPLVVFWRMEWSEYRRPLVLGATVVTGVLSLYLSLPDHAKPVTEARTIGHAIEDRFGGYDEMEHAVFGRHEILLQIIPSGWEPAVPERFGGHPNIWTYYAFHKNGGQGKVNYILQPASLPPPNGTELLAKEGEVALYVVDTSVLEAHRKLSPPSPAGSAVYRISRDLLLRKTQPLDETLQVILERLGWQR